MTDLATARHQLVMANRILANEGILDAFGHVTVRHPEHADRFLMAWARAPELIEDADLLELTLDGTVVDASGRVSYLERFTTARSTNSGPKSWPSATITLCRFCRSAFPRRLDYDQ